MDEVVSFLMGAVLIGLLVGVASSLVARDIVRDQAIAAGVACYQAKPDGRTDFRWNCKQP